MRQNRNRKIGSMITFATVLLLALVVLGLGFIAFLMYMGGQSQTKNAVDAGTLNVGREALDKVTVNISPTSTYRDVASDDENGNRSLVNLTPKASLRNINRIWAKAMTIAINAEDAKSAGNAGSGGSKANNAFNEAKQISDNLAQKLNDQSNLHGFFSEFASRNSVRMLGADAKVNPLPGAGWQTSLLERERESNITLAGTPSDNFFMPPRFSLNGNYTTKSTRTNIPNSGKNLWFLKGYQPISIGPNTFWQVPFPYDAKPHMVSRSIFETNQPANKALSWQNAVPNAYSAQGVTSQKSAIGEKARSWVLTNPKQPFKMAIPHSFVRIDLDQMKSKWYFFPVGPPIKFAEQDYNYMIENQSSTMPLGGVGSSSVGTNATIIGSEVVGRSLDDIIFGIPGGNTTELENYLVNRANEMITEVGTKITKSKLHSVLGSGETRAALALASGKTSFFLYSPDGKKLVCRPELIAKADPSANWLKTIISKTPDGDEKTMVNDAKMIAILGAPLGTVTPLPFFVMTVNAKWGFYHKSLYWTPGTGYNGCLGTVRVNRSTKVYMLGVCVPI